MSSPKIKVSLSKLPYELLERICKQIADTEEDLAKEANRQRLNEKEQKKIG